MTRSDSDRIQDIITACRKLSEIASEGRRRFDKNWITRDAA